VPLPSLGRLSSRTNLKAVNPGRHRNSAAKEAETEVEDHELTSYLAALAPDADPESTGSGNRFGDAQVYQLRMNTIASEQLKEIALERGTSPHALAQEWILERLSWEGQAASGQRRQQPPQAQSPQAQHPQQPQPRQAQPPQMQQPPRPPQRQVRRAVAPERAAAPDNEATDKHDFPRGWDWPAAAPH
jgi:hypothetical protein